MIPKVIHYCWFGGNPLNDMAKKCIDSWKKYCPDCKIIEWNETNFDIENACDYVKEAYQAKKWAFVSDYVRFKILYEQGGIYFDTDVELIKPLDAVVENGSFMGAESYFPIGVAPGLGIGAEKGLGIYKEILDEYHKSKFLLSNGEFNLKTVVSYTTEVFKRYGIQDKDAIQIIKDIDIYPKEYFCPKDYETGEISITKNTVSIHHFNASWHDDYTKILNEKRRYYVNAYGEKGQEMFLKWLKKNHLFILLKTKGIRFTTKKIMKKILR